MANVVVTQEKSIEKVSMSYQQGGSDKVYIVEMKEQTLQDGRKGHAVHCHYGRRGSTMNFANKTPSPVSYILAKQALDRVVHEKTRKGYQIDGTIGAQSTTAGTPPQPPSPIAFGLSPQLLNPVKDDRELKELLSNDLWYVQEKKDGERRMVQRFGDSSWKGYNKRGVEIALPEQLITTLDSINLPNEVLLDGEIIGDIYHVFDVLCLRGLEIANEPFSIRVEYLQGALERAKGACPYLQVVPVVIGEKAKRAYLESCKAAISEGVVFKHADSKYIPGRPNSGGDQLKYKFVESATVVVSRVNPGKRSVAFGAYDDELAYHELGNVTIPPNQEIPERSSFIEVRYLYAYKGGSLYQPVYLGKRSDQLMGDCTLSQLKYKSVLETIPAESSQDTRWAW